MRLTLFALVLLLVLLGGSIEALFQDQAGLTDWTAENLGEVRDALVAGPCAKSAANPDYLLTVADIEDWESRHGVIPPRHWILMRTDWYKRKGDAYTNKRADGAHTPGPSPEVVRFLIAQRDLHGFGTETIGTDAGQAQLQSGLHRFDPKKGKFKLLVAMEPGSPENRLNDGVVDPKGRLWFGTMDDSEKSRTGAYYCFHRGKLTRTNITSIAITNGPAISPDGSVLY
ncbi:SMP-30/gluconolactonase/LRE family protein [Acidovorax sp. BLS4]|uniref:SMP-30/gluconolactonase/LRE family protein n=1 Tax=Acidovorax sp. BLS4 TaxID=3273430 RepID=UPI0029436F7F|nr:SMP-30/gluconolactonase/LRE family protein [Paracidovorax avenae]WOI45576.1 SMP-30/gluconolactonase/LRE family protein [Paracidovorax avenae]